MEIIVDNIIAAAFMIFSSAFLLFCFSFYLRAANVHDTMEPGIQNLIVYFLVAKA